MSEYQDSRFWLETYRDGFIEFTAGDDDSECFEIVGMFTAIEAVAVHTFVSPDYDYLQRHAQSLFDWLVDSPEQRVPPEQGMGGANRFFLPNSNRTISFTAIRPKSPIPWYPYTENFPEPILIVFARHFLDELFIQKDAAPTAEAKFAGWIEAQLLPQFEDFDLVLCALEDYFGIE